MWNFGRRTRDFTTSLHEPVEHLKHEYKAVTRNNNGSQSFLRNIKNARQTAREISKHKEWTIGRRISCSILCRWLHRNDLLVQRPTTSMVCTINISLLETSISVMPMKQEMDITDVGRIFIAYEKRFRLSNKSGRMESPLQQHHKDTCFVSAGILVWRGIMLGSRANRFVYKVYSIIFRLCWTEILLSHVLLFRCAIVSGFHIMSGIVNLFIQRFSQSFSKTKTFSACLGLKFLVT